MGHTGTIMISRYDIYLRFMFQAAKGFGMENPVPVPLEFRAKITLLHRMFPSSLPALSRQGRKNLIFLFLDSFPHIHPRATSVF